MNVAIVGTSKLTDSEKIGCKRLINHILSSYNLAELVIVSGGAPGVDTIAEEVAKEKGLKTKIFKPKGTDTKDYMIRNAEIALECNDLYCLSTPVKDTACYHHGETAKDHQKTAGCYTMNLVLEQNKDAELYIIER